MHCPGPGSFTGVDRANGVLSPVGAVTVALPLDGAVIGFDFNPTVDRIRVVTPSGHNLRLHPDTGAMVDGDATRDGVQPDGALRYVVGDVNFGSAPDIAGAAYTYNTRDETITTNYAIDRARGALVMAGLARGRGARRLAQHWPAAHRRRAGPGGVDRCGL